MKNHIVFKFLAVLLCALSLLSAILCIIGIAVLEQQELYEEDLEAQYAQRLDDLCRSAARSIANRYASRNLGGCDDLLIDAYYGSSVIDDFFQANTFFYTLEDASGTVLASTYTNVSSAEVYKYQITTGSYIRLIAEIPSELVSNGSNQPAMEPTRPDSDTSYDTIHVYDESLGTYRAFQIQRVELPEYTVTVYLLPNALQGWDSYEWLLLLWQSRYNLFYILIGSLLLFAVCAVYLCCAAGRKPGSDEVSPGGFNALPLDLYTVGAGFLVFLSFEIAREFSIWYDPGNLIFFAFLAFLGFFDCLLLVVYCFAWAAQIKVGNGRWWRKSAIGWLVLEFFRFLRQDLPNICSTIWRGIKWFCRGIKKVFVFLVTEAFTVLKWFFKGLWRFLKILFALGAKLLAALWVQIRRGWKWIWGMTHRFLSLLPLTWQWLLTGFVMMCVVYGTLRTYRTGWILVGVGIIFTVILYGAHAFGILLEGAKRMSQGDLDTKVSDQFLVGSFREFSHDLNALADVAVVAAEKQMKSERMKTELITNVSHDIKTPLTSIINYVDLLQKPHTPEEEAQYLEVLDRKSAQLKKLIEDLMEMSKATTGNLAVDIRQVDAAEAVNQALGEFADKLAARQLQCVLSVPEAPVLMMADGRLAWRVLGNLLNNAYKYAMPGTRLYIDIQKVNGKVQISLKNVSAQPLNISADELMERFVRGDAARNTEGSGLGLNIAKSLMDVQHGTLSLHVDGDLFKATLEFPGL